MSAKSASHWRDSNLAILSITVLLLTCAGCDPPRRAMTAPVRPGSTTLCPTHTFRYADSLHAPEGECGACYPCVI